MHADKSRRFETAVVHRFAFPEPISQNGKGIIRGSAPPPHPIDEYYNSVGQADFAAILLTNMRNA